MKINGVFEGGGVKAVGLVGALKAAEERGITFNQVAGTSSGAIVATLLAAGYRADEMKDILFHTPFQDFLKKDIFHQLSGFGLGTRLFLKKGLYSNQTLEKWITGLLKDKGVICFGDLPKDQVRIIASDISNGRMLVLPDDLIHYDRNPETFSVARAISMSTAIPYFFEPVKLGNNYIVDGAILSNYPLWLFDKHYKKDEKLVPAIGFHLVAEKDKEPNKIIGPLSMFRALFSTMMDAHDERYIHKNARFRTVKIPTMGVRSTEFDLSDERKEALFRSGYEAANRFFDRWSLAAYLTLFEQTMLEQSSDRDMV